MAKLIYIQIQPSQLFVGKLKKTKSKFLLTNSKVFNLNNLEVTNKALFNLSKIYIHLKQYLKEQKLKKAKAIICSPAISKIKDPIKNLFLLQQILAFCKAGIIIEKIIEQPQWQKESNMALPSFFPKKNINNQLNFFKRFLPPKNKSTYKWIITTILMASLLIVLQVKLLTIQKEKLSLTNKKANELRVENELLETQLKQIHLLQIENKKLETRKNKIIKKHNKKITPKNILLSIANTIPKNCWLERLKIKTEPKQNPKDSSAPKQKVILLEGKAFDEKEILKFIDSLTKTPQLASLKIETIKRDKNKFKNTTNPYSFKLRGIYK